MRCPACGASVIEGAPRCYRCERSLDPPPPPARRARPWAAAGFGALAVVSVLDVVLLHDSAVLLAATLAFGALATLAFFGRARGWCIGAAAVGAALGVMAALGGGILVGPAVALASGSTLAALLLPTSTPARPNGKGARS